MAAVDLDVWHGAAAQELPQAYRRYRDGHRAGVRPGSSRSDGSPYAPATVDDGPRGIALEAFRISVPPRSRAAALDWANAATCRHADYRAAQVVQDNGLSALTCRTTPATARWSLDDIQPTFASTR